MPLQTNHQTKSFTFRHIFMITVVHLKSSIFVNTMNKGKKRATQRLYQVSIPKAEGDKFTSEDKEPDKQAIWTLQDCLTADAARKDLQKSRGCARCLSLCPAANGFIYTPLNSDFAKFDTRREKYHIHEGWGTEQSGREEGHRVKKRAGHRGKLFANTALCKRLYNDGFSARVKRQLSLHQTNDEMLPSGAKQTTLNIKSPVRPIKDGGFLAGRTDSLTSSKNDPLINKKTKYTSRLSQLAHAQSSLLLPIARIKIYPVSHVDKRLS
ncbi:hypothetical protein J6590_105111 [Homalodisca vitripennis]|nr:hypothetical protein J6590_105111 [Homalodisca vitripennis]